MIDEAIAGKIMTVGVAYSDEWFYPISFCHQYCLPQQDPASLTLALHTILSE
jgi:hypothetical protein